MTLFPIIQPLASGASSSELALYREVAWDFSTNVPIYQNGAPKIITGKDAVLVWAWKALHTTRFRHEIYTTDYGCDAENLIGQPFTEALKQSEAARFVRECLTINPYVSGVSGISVTFSDGLLTIECTLETVYGQVNLNV